MSPASADSLGWLFPFLPVVTVSLRSDTDTQSSRDSSDAEQLVAGNGSFYTSANSPRFTEDGSLACVQSSREPGFGGSRWQQSPARAGRARERSVWEGLALLQALKSHFFALLTLIRSQRAALPGAWLEPAEAAAGTGHGLCLKLTPGASLRCCFIRAAPCKGTSGSWY